MRASSRIIGTKAATSQQVIQNGLLVHIDPDISASYSGSGATIYNLVNNQAQTLYGSYSKPSIGIRLNNPSSDRLANTSRLQVQSYSGIRMISVWVYAHSANATRYLLDARTGSSGGYIYDGGYGPDWPYYYLNNGARSAPSVSDTFSTGVWKFITVEHTSSFTDDVTMFSRFSNDEAWDCTFGKILFYNTVLSQADITANFNATRSLYGI